ncbi:MAG: hypothetical protein IKT00_00315 [Prevotella sp.]|nr:hypothetical protein [Prevotella sp.]
MKRNGTLNAIVARQMVRLLANGAFGQPAHLEVMSLFKWNRLVNMAEDHEVLDYLGKGMNNNLSEFQHFPDQLVDTIRNRLRQFEPPVFSERYSVGAIHFYSSRQKITFAELSEKDLFDTTPETRRMFLILMRNVCDMLLTGFCLRGLLDLGLALRTEGNHVDFVKLELWLGLMDLQRMVQLQGSILHSIFGFDLNELPFMDDLEPDAYRVALGCISDISRYSSSEWNFRQVSGGFLFNNSRQWLRGLRRTRLYFPYSPKESMRSLFHSIARSLSEIEE